MNVPFWGVPPILREVPELTDRFAKVMLDRRLENEQFLENMRRSDEANSDFVPRAGWGRPGPYLGPFGPRCYRRSISTAGFLTVS